MTSRTVRHFLFVAVAMILTSLFLFGPTVGKGTDKTAPKSKAASVQKQAAPTYDKSAIQFKARDFQTADERVNTDKGITVATWTPNDQTPNVVVHAERITPDMERFLLKAIKQGAKVEVIRDNRRRETRATVIYNGHAAPFNPDSVRWEHGNRFLERPISVTASDYSTAANDYLINPTAYREMVRDGKRSGR